MNKIILFFGLFFLGSCFAKSAATNNDNKIIAVVNDNIITKLDVTNKIKLFAKLANIAIDQNNSKEFFQNTLATTIDETLKLQKISEFVIRYNDNRPLVSLEDLQKYLDNILQKNNISKGEFDDFLKKNGISMEFVLKQIDANLSWNRYIVDFFASNIQTSDAEVNSVINQLSEKNKCKTYILGRIVIPFSSANEYESKLKIDEALYYLQQGVAFELVANNFSSSSDAQNGGFIGPVRENQLKNNELQIVQNISEGGYSTPIRNDDEFVIYKVYKVKKRGDNYLTKITAKRIEFYVDKNDMENVATQILKNSSDAKTFLNEIEKDNRVQIKDDEVFIVEEMRPEVQSFMLTLTPGKISSPVPTPNGFAVFYTKNKEKLSEKMPSSKEVRMSIQNRKLESMSRKHFQEIKSNALIKKMK